MSMIPEGLTAICDYNKKEGVIIFACRADMKSLEGCFSQDVLEQITRQYFPDTHRDQSDGVIFINSKDAPEMLASILDCLKNEDKEQIEELLVKLTEKRRCLYGEDRAETFAERLRLLIGDRSVRSFAAELNISPSGLHQYLTGKSDPSRAVLSLIASKTGVNMQWLVDGTGPMFIKS